MFSQKLTSRDIYSILKKLDRLGPRPCGSENLGKAFEYFRKKYSEIEPADIHFDTFHAKRFRRGECNISILNHPEIRPDILSLAFCADIEKKRLPLIYINEGKAADFEDLETDVEGKVVLAKSVIGYHRSKVIKQAQKQSAAGVLMISNLPDGYPQTGFASQLDKYPKVFGGGIDRQSGNRLIELIESGHKLEIEIAISSKIEKATARNLIVDFGDCADKHILLTAHLDSWDISSSISDNGSGVAVMFDLARLMSGAGQNLRVALFDAEEQGLKGSNDYIKRYDISKISLIINFDIVGDPFKLAQMHIGRETPPLIESGSHKIPVYSTTYKKLAYTSDHIPFTRRGVPTLIPISKMGFGRGKYYHTRYDNLDNFNYPGIYDWPGIINKYINND